MRIGFDARMYGPIVGGGGLGRYVESLLQELLPIDKENAYLLFTKQGTDLSKLSLNPQKVSIIETDIHWYTLKEQIEYRKVLDRQNLDLIHFPHWNVPIGLKTPFVVTIHDLILLEEPASAHATTLNPLKYWLKRIGYRLVLSHALKKSRKIIAISESTKASILKFFPSISEEKIEVIHNGFTSLEKTQTKEENQPPYLLYVGNAYPHKNLPLLLKAFEDVHKKYPYLFLVLAGRSDIFYERLLRSIDPKLLLFIRFAQNPSDTELAELYTNADAFVFPSKIEGFGIPPLEALSVGTKVLASDIPVHREILKDNVSYFPKNDEHALSKAISEVLDAPKMNQEKIDELLSNYSWNKTAMMTHAVYARATAKTT